MLKKLSGYLATYTLVSALALLVPLIITPHMQLHEGDEEYSISQILIIASFIGLTCASIGKGIVLNCPLSFNKTILSKFSI